MKKLDKPDYEPVRITRNAKQIVVSERGRDIAKIPVNSPLIVRYLDCDYCISASTATDVEIYSAIKGLLIFGVSYEATCHSGRPEIV